MARHFTKDRFNGAPILKSPLKLIGAKTKIRDLLYRCFPDHDRYFEPFMGSCGVAIGKERCGSEFISDVNEFAIRFFRFIQSDPEEFWRVFQGELAELQSFKQERFEQLKRFSIRPPVSRQAVGFYLITKVCMNGIWRLNKDGEINSAYCGTVDGRGFMDREWFELLRERIAKMNFFCSDYRPMLELAREDDFVFLDPPYHDCKTTYNGIGWGDTEYRELLKSCRSTSAKWLLTINDDAFIRSLFSGYCIVPHSVHYSCSQTAAGRGQKPELLIANYEISLPQQEIA